MQMMRNTLTILLCVCASLFLSAQENVQSPDSARAVITFDRTYYNFGKVIAGETITFHFTFTNTGNAPLIVSDVTRTEGGFVPDAFPKEPIAPGKTGEIKISYNSTGKPPGEFSKEQSVWSNGSDKPIVLHLSGFIVDPNGPIMKFDTTTYWFDTVYQNTIVDAEFRFTNKGKTPLLITDVIGSSGSICPSYPKEPIAPGKSATIVVLFHTGGKYGMQHKCVTVKSNASEPTIILNVKGFVILPPPVKQSPVPERDDKSGQ